MEKTFGITDFRAMSPERKLSELGLDSLVAVELKQALEWEHEIVLTKEHLQHMTVHDILSIDAGIFDASKIKKYGSSQEIINLFKLHNTSLVSLKSRPSGPNVFIVHGTDGRCHNFNHLASRFKANVHLFQFSGKDGWNSTPELARLYVRELQEKQLAGPDIIMGFSAGSALAFEAAKRLQNSEETVQNLVFLDGCPSFNKENLNRTFALDMLNAMNVLRKLSDELIKIFESSLTGDVGQDFLETVKILKEATGYELSPTEVIAYAFLNKQLSQYSICEPYRGDLILIQAKVPTINTFSAREDYNVRTFCTGQNTQRKVRWNHLSFFNEENVDETA